jgi:hypothetical protein
MPTHRFILDGVLKGYPPSGTPGCKWWFIDKVQSGVEGVFSATGWSGNRKSEPGKKWFSFVVFLVFPDFFT